MFLDSIKIFTILCKKLILKKANGMCKIAHCKSLKLILLQSRNLLEHNVLKIMLHLKKDQVKSKIFIMIDAY